MTVDYVREQLALVDDLGWDSGPGIELLEHLRQGVVRPLVRRSGLAGPAADQAESSGWAAAWDALRRPSARAAVNPLGMAWVAARRAVHVELGGRGGLGGPSSSVVPAQSSGNSSGTEPTLWLMDASLLERRTAGQVTALGAGLGPGAGALDPGPGDHRSGLGPHLEGIVDRLADAGWSRDVAADLVAALSAGCQHANGRVVMPWRRVAAEHGVAPWRVRRLASLLVGGRGGPGILALLVVDGTPVLADECVAAALRSTSHRWAASPEVLLRPLVRSGTYHNERHESGICLQKGRKRTLHRDPGAAWATRPRPGAEVDDAHGGCSGGTTTTASPPPSDPGEPG
jgi:hypothetical protein